MFKVTHLATVPPLNSSYVAGQNDTHLGNEWLDPATPYPAFHATVWAWRQRPASSCALRLPGGPRGALTELCWLLIWLSVALVGGPEG